MFSGLLVVNPMAQVPLAAPFPAAARAVCKLDPNNFSWIEGRKGMRPLQKSCR